MTAQLAAVPGLNAAPGDELAVLRGMLRPDFLARAGWDRRGAGPYPGAR